MAEITLVCGAIPGPGIGVITRIPVLDEARGVGDDVVLVYGADEAVDGGAVDFGWTTAGFEVKDKGRAGDEAHAAPFERAHHVFGLMNGRVEVLVA